LSVSIDQAAKSFVDPGQFGSLEQEALVLVSLTPDQLQVLFTKAENLGQQVDDGTVGLSLLGSRGDPHQQGSFSTPTNFIAGGTGDGPDR
jgi:hypothetical protein